MSFSETLQVVGAALFSVVSAGVIVVALSSWLGKVWAERILQSERSAADQQLQEHRQRFEAWLAQQGHAADVQRTRLERLLDRGSVVHRFQAEKEFDCYQALWATATEAYDRACMIRPSLGGPASKEDVETRLQGARPALEAFGRATIQHEPFYAGSVLAIARKLHKLLQKEMLAAELGAERRDPRWWDEGRANRDQMNDLLDQLSGAIRARLEEMSVVEPQKLD